MTSRPHFCVTIVLLALVMPRFAAAQQSTSPAAHADRSKSTDQGHASHKNDSQTPPAKGADHLEHKFHDAVEWAKRGAELGAGEICVNSIDQDGTHAGYDLEITRLITDVVNVPVIASGGAGSAEHVAQAFLEAGAYAAIVSSLLYSPRLEKRPTVRELKATLANEYGVAIRPYIED